MNDVSPATDLVRRDQPKGIARFLRLDVALSALSVIAILAFLYVATGRLFFQYDLEWTEGGQLIAAERIAAGQPLYAPPSLDYVAFPYPPVFAGMTAFWIPIAGQGFHVARGVSIFYILLAGVMLGLGLAGRRRASILLGLGLFFAAFEVTGGFFDLALPDAAALGLFSVAFWLARGGEGASLPRALGAAMFAWLAGFAFQPYLFYGLGLLGVLFLSNRKSGGAALIAYGALVTGSLILGLSQNGWPLVFMSTLPIRAWPASGFSLFEGFRGMLRAFSPAILLAALACAKALGEKGMARYRTLALLLCFGLGSVIAYTLPMGGPRAFLPLAWFLALEAVRWWDHVPVLASRAQGLASARGLARLAAVVVLLQYGCFVYNPIKYVPAPIDVWVGSTMLSKMRMFDGDVLIPEHPYSLVQAGRKPNYHSAALAWYKAAGLPLPRDFFGPVARQRFSFVITDGKSTDPEIGRHYDFHQNVDVPGASLLEKTGRQTRPASILIPRLAKAKP